jgi:hypothetical protein
MSILSIVLAQSLPPEAWDGQRYLMAPWMYEQIKALEPQMTEKSVIEWDYNTRKVWLRELDR